ncbi:MAG: hypothetical protein JWM16_831 [Verrucomicrobiales bacterium]|nr:hypothetical protein [Verrucomicrobiales bacterium]
MKQNASFPAQERRRLVAEREIDRKIDSIPIWKKKTVFKEPYADIYLPRSSRSLDGMFQPSRAEIFPGVSI